MLCIYLSLQQDGFKSILLINSSPPTDCLYPPSLWREASSLGIFYRYFSTNSFSDLRIACTSVSMALLYKVFFLYLSDIPSITLKHDQSLFVIFHLLYLRSKHQNFLPSFFQVLMNSFKSVYLILNAIFKEWHLQLDFLFFYLFFVEICQSFSYTK